MKVSNGFKMVLKGLFAFFFLYLFVIQSCKTVWPRASSDPHEDSKFAIHPVAAQHHHTTNWITSNHDSQAHIITSVLQTFGVKVWRNWHPIVVKRTSPADISCSPVGWKSIEEMAPALRDVNHCILRSRLLPLKDMFIIANFKLSFHFPCRYRNLRSIGANGTATVWIGRRSVVFSLRNPSNTRCLHEHHNTGEACASVLTSWVMSPTNQNLRWQWSLQAYSAGRETLWYKKQFGSKWQENVKPSP